MPSMAGILLVLLACALLLAGYMDIRYRRLPNWLAAVTLVIGVLHLFAVSESLAPVGSGLLHAVIALVVGMVFYRAALFGGGDAKYYAAVAAGVPLAGALKFLLAVAVAGLVAVILWFIVRRSLRKEVSRKAQSDFAKFPLGVAISLGGLAYFAGWA